MSKSNKRKKPTQNRKPIGSHVAITKSYFDDYVKTACKFMLLIGLEPAMFEALTKRTKQTLMIVKHTPYRIRAEKDSRVPRAYIKFFNAIMSEHEKKTFYGDPKFNITYLEYITYGMTLIFSIRNFDRRDIFIPQDQIELLEQIRTALIAFTDNNIDDSFAVRPFKVLRNLFMYVSQPNYRFYSGIEAGVPDWSKGRLENQLTISSVEPERKNFSIDGKIHSAYRLGYYNIFEDTTKLEPVQAEIPMNLLEEENNNTKKQLMSQIKTTIKLPVYIQNHALRRLDERLDCKDNMYQNFIFSLSFLLPGAVTAVNGQRLIKAIDLSGKAVGYFPFIKQDGAVLLLSFLPLSSPITPEGSVLNKELGIQLEDSKYIGLDKLSFYTNTDFDKVPKLRQALKKAGMWHLTEIVPNNKADRKEDRILSVYFKDVLPEQEFEID